MAAQAIITHLTFVDIRVACDAARCRLLELEPIVAGCATHVGMLLKEGKACLLVLEGTVAAHSP